MKKLLCSIIWGCVVLSCPAQSLDSICVSGHISGYVPDSGITHLSIYVADPVTGNGVPRVLPVANDGSFARSFPLDMAQMARLTIPIGLREELIDAFIAPGHELDKTIELDSITGAKAEYGGSLGQLNSELAAAPQHDFLWTGRFSGLSPKQAKDSIMGYYNRQQALLTPYISKLPPESAAGALLRAEVEGNRAYSLLDYADYNESHSTLPQSWYADFLPGVLSADSLNLADYNITNAMLTKMILSRRKSRLAATELPRNTEGGMLMRALLAPYRGKYLLVDFWDTTCGPCRAGIQSSAEFRKRYAQSPHFDFLFLCSELGSPKEAYERFVAEYLVGEDVMRLPEAQMVLLRELFEFNAIPRYVFFDPEGRVISSDFSLHEFRQFLSQHGLTQ